MCSSCTPIDSHPSVALKRAYRSWGHHDPRIANGAASFKQFVAWLADSDSSLRDVARKWLGRPSHV